MSRYRFFMVAFCASFCWYWLPDFIMPALGYFTFICWAAPNNTVVNQVFGMNSGMGLFPLTLDCKYLTPLITQRSDPCAQGVKSRTSGRRWWCRRGQSSTSSRLLCCGSGSCRQLCTTLIRGIRRISRSRVIPFTIILEKCIMLHEYSMQANPSRSTIQSITNTPRYADILSSLPSWPWY